MEKADKAFNIQDIFVNKEVEVNIPTKVKGVNRLPTSKLTSDRLISSKRVNIERTIGNAKPIKY